MKGICSRMNVAGRVLIVPLVLIAAACQQARGPSESVSPAQGISMVHDFEMPISGVISVDGHLKNKVAKTDVLFISAYRSDMPKGFGPPLAAKRISEPKFPYHYQIGPEDLIQGGTRFLGQISVYARIDKDGDAGPVEPGDMEGHYSKNPAVPGQRGADIVIDKLY